MYKQEEITSIFNRFIQAEKKKDFECYPGHKDCCENAESIAVHARKGKFPERLFKYKSPGQTAEEYTYIKNNYKNVTQPVFLDFLNTILRSFHDSNWSINYGEEKKQYVEYDLTFKKYIENEIGDHKSVESYMKNVIGTLKLIDAMGVIAIKPYELNYLEDEDGNFYVDDNELIKPRPFFYSCHQVKSNDDDDFFLIETNEKSVVEYGAKKERIGRVFEFYDEYAIWKITQVGKFTESNYEIKPFYIHELGRIPVSRLKGIPIPYDDKVCWYSPFLYAVDVLDLVAINSQNLQVIINKCVFPVTIMLGNICDFESDGMKCSDGMVFDQEKGISKQCPKCHGSGLVARLSPMQTLLLRPEQRGVAEAENKGNIPPLQFVSPSTETPEFLIKKIALDEDKARKILHLHTSNSDVKGSQDMTATGMAIDQKAAYAFIQPIAWQMFELFEWMLKTIGTMRYGQDFVAPQITYPVSFDMNTEQDVLATIGEAVKNNLPSPVIYANVYRYLSTIFYTEKTTQDIFTLITAADRILVLSEDDIAIKFANGTILSWEVILHDSSIVFVKELINENPKFFEQELTKQIEQLVEKAKAKAMEMPKAEGAEDAMGRIIEGGLTPDAAANLKGSVGGLTGMIEIAKAVAAGLYDLDAAVALVSDRFGLSEEEARRQLGTPQQVQTEGEADKIAKLT